MSITIPEDIMTQGLRALVPDLWGKYAYQLTSDEARKVRRAKEKVEVAWTAANVDRVDRSVAEIVAAAVRGESSLRYFRITANKRKQVKIEEISRFDRRSGDRPVRVTVSIADTKEWMKSLLPAGLEPHKSGEYLRVRTTGASAMRQKAHDRTIADYGLEDVYLYVREVINASDQWADENRIDPEYLTGFERQIKRYKKNYMAMLKEVYRERGGLSESNKVYTVRDAKRAEQAKKSKPNTLGNLETFLSKRSLQALPADTRAIAAMPVAEHGVLSSRTWGIEIEAAGRRGVEAPKGWKEVSDGSLRSAYTDSANDERQFIAIDAEDCPEYGWSEESGGNGTHQEYIEVTMPNGDLREIGNPDFYDSYYCNACGDRIEIDEDHPAWVEPEAPAEGEQATSQRFTGAWYGRDTGEFVSPILKSFHSRGLEEITNKLIHEPTNSSAGVHVHVGAADLTPKQVGSVVFAWHLIEPLLESSYRREVRTYARARTNDEVVSVLKSTKTATSVTADMYAGGLNHGDRYRTVNLQSLTKHGTIEFRAMGNVYEYEYLLKWASFCREMVNVAKSNVPVNVWTAVKTFDDVLAIFQAYGKEQNANIDSEYAALTEDERVLVEQ